MGCCKIHAQFARTVHIIHTDERYVKHILALLEMAAWFQVHGPDEMYANKGENTK